MTAGTFTHRYVQCTRCDMWHHYVCAMYPAPEQLPRAWGIEKELFVCKSCLAAAPAVPTKKADVAAAAASAKLRELQCRRASDLPRCEMATAIESFVTSELKCSGVTLAAPVVVRVVSRKRWTAAGTFEEAARGSRRSGFLIGGRAFAGTSTRP